MSDRPWDDRSLPRSSRVHGSPAPRCRRDGDRESHHALYRLTEPHGFHDSSRQAGRSRYGQGRAGRPAIMAKLHLPLSCRAVLAGASAAVASGVLPRRAHAELPPLKVGVIHPTSGFMAAIGQILQSRRGGGAGDPQGARLSRPGHRLWRHRVPTRHRPRGRRAADRRRGSNPGRRFRFGPDDDARPDRRAAQDSAR